MNFPGVVCMKNFGGVNSLGECDFVVVSVNSLGKCGFVVVSKYYYW